MPAIVEDDDAQTDSVRTEILLDTDPQCPGMAAAVRVLA